MSLINSLKCRIDGTVRIPFRHVARVTVSLPLIGFIFSICYALYSDSIAATSTHCGVSHNVKNYLPSVSAAIGSFPLSQLVWRICITLHAAPRFGVALMYYRYLKSVVYRKHLRLSAFVCCLNVVENIGLIGLTFISSTDNYSIHEKCFIIFVTCSTSYMILLSAVLKYTRNVPPTELEAKSLKWKLKLVTIYFIFIGFCAYTFTRHNMRCEDGMYTLFALCEYVVILSNMGFHMTAYWDFYDRALPSYQYFQNPY